MRLFLESPSNPTHHPSSAREDNLSASKFFTHMRDPQIGKPVKSRIFPVANSYRVFPSLGRVPDRRLSHAACIKASTQRKRGSSLLRSMDCTHSISVRLTRSARPLEKGESCAVSHLVVPCISKCLVNCSLKNSPPRSLCKCLICAPYWVIK